MGFFDKAKEKGKERNQDGEYQIMEFREGKSNSGKDTFSIGLKGESGNLIYKIYYPNEFGKNLLSEDLKLLFGEDVNIYNIEDKELRDQLIGFGLKVGVSVTWDVSARGKFQNIKFCGPAWEPAKGAKIATDEIDEFDDLDKLLELD